MKKINYFIFPFLLLILINNCTGYEPIFNTSNLKFRIDNYSIKGDKNLGQKLYSKLYAISQKKTDQDLENIDITINITKDKNPTSKNSAGKILSYKITLKTEIKINNYFDGNKILYETFISSDSYENQNQYSDTLKLENQSIDNLINNTFEKILIKLTQNI
jgi:hypothetical protein